MAKVIQADRDAAAIAEPGIIDVARSLSSRAWGASQGEMRTAREQYLVQAFAAYREASTAQLLAERDELVARLSVSMTAIDDWLNTYADDMCDPDRVAEARARIGQFGTLAYIAEVQTANRDVLSRIQGQGEYTCGGGE